MFLGFRVWGLGFEGLGFEGLGFVGSGFGVLGLGKVFGFSRKVILRV